MIPRQIPFKTVSCVKVKYSPLERLWLFILSKDFTTGETERGLKVLYMAGRPEANNVCINITTTKGLILCRLKSSSSHMIKKKYNGTHHLLAREMGNPLRNCTNRSKFISTHR